MINFNLGSKYLCVLFVLFTVNNYGLASVEEPKQCKENEILITVNSSKFDSEGSISNITFWNSNGNLYLDESYAIEDDKGNCFDSSICYHLFLYGTDDFRVFVNGSLVEEGQVHEDGRLYRIGNCSKRDECETGYEIFLFSINDYNFTLKSSEVIVDAAYITEREARVYCVDPTDCYELHGKGYGYYSESKNNVLIDQGDAKFKRFGSGCVSKCDRTPLLTDTNRGRDITVELGTMSGMQSMSDLDSSEYKAACWIIHDDLMQIEASSNTLVQRYVLALLYFATEGESWDNDHNFLGPLSECEWHNAFNQGVFCNDFGRVTDVRLVFNEIKGTIITEINRFLTTYEESFVITGSDLAGSIPTQIASLNHLRELDLSNNILGGKIPSLVKLNKLHKVVLSNNYLTGSIPSFASNIVIIDLRHNFLNGTISHFNIGNLTRLKEIILHDNQLSGVIPSSIASLSNLENLNLYQNNFNGTIPSKLFKLTYLNYVDLSSNGLTGEIPNKFAVVNSMKHLDLSDLQLNRTIPPKISTLSHLEFLDVSNNTLSGSIASEFSNLRNLATFKIRDNSITGVVPFENCSQFRMLNADCDTPVDIVCKCCKSCRGFYTNPQKVINCETGELGIRFFDVEVNDDVTFSLENDANQLLLQSDKDAKDTGNMTYESCISPTDCFHLTSRSDAPLVLLHNNIEVLPEYRTFVDIEFGYSRQIDSIAFNTCDSFELCGTLVEPNTEKRNLINILTRFSGTSIFQNTSTVQYQASCWWMKDLERRDDDDLKDTALIQRYLLSLFFYSTGGDSWYENNFWLTENSVCTWYGISCYNTSNNKGIINGIRLANNKLSGVLPTEIGELLGLEYLIINANNDLSGLLPKEIKYLKMLRELKCADTLLSHTIPTEIGILENLLVLDLSNCRFIGSIPSELAHVTKLNIFRASSNSFFGTLPDISSLMELKVIELGENFIEGACSSISKLKNLEYLDLRDNFFSDKIPILPKNQKKLKIIHLEKNKFYGILPINLGSLTALEELWLYDNLLSSYLPHGIGQLTKLKSLYLGYNDIRGTMPEAMINMRNLEHLHLHHNRLTGSAVNFGGKLKDYVTDCGATVSDEALIECDDCSVCCNVDGDCVLTSATYPNLSMMSNLSGNSSVAAFLPFLLIVAISVSILIICAAISRTKLSYKLPQIPFKVRTDFQAESVYKFFLTSSILGWLVALCSGAVHVGIVILFIRSSDFSSGMNDTEYTYTCSKYDYECESDLAIHKNGWLIFGILLFIFLFKDLADGAMMVYEGVTLNDRKGTFAGAFVMFLTISSAMISTVYNFSTGISNSDILKDAAILLFIHEIDEQSLGILKRMFPSWVEKLEEEISPLNEGSSAEPNDTDEEKGTGTTSEVYRTSESSTQHSQQAMNKKHFLISPTSDHDVNTSMPRPQATGLDSFEIISKINEIQQQIDMLQMEVNRLVNQSLRASSNNKVKKYSTTKTNNSEEILPKIMKLQKEIYRLRAEMNGVRNKLEGFSDTHDIIQRLKASDSEF